MAGQTPRFALNYFGGDTDGSLSDDNDKYTSQDRVLIDTLLAALERHNHRLPTTQNGPTDSADLGIVQGSGDLEGGTTYYYVLSFVDADGLETVSGPEASIATPDILPAPDGPQGNTSTLTGNTLTPGLYYYALTGLRGDEESALGTIATVTVLDDENTATLTCPDLGEATSYQLWRLKDTDPQWTRIVQGSGDLVDDGSVAAAVFGDPANTPPTANAGVSNYSLQITLGADDATAVQATAGWRIYRSTVSGQYSSDSLVAEVVERTDETDPTSALLTSFFDDGDAALTGSPVLVSTQLQIPAFTFEQADPLPDASAYPQNYPILDAAGVLYINRSSTWTAISGSGGGGTTTPARGLPFMGTWDTTVSSSGSPYQDNDVVIYGQQLWQATTTPATGTPPSLTPVGSGQVIGTCDHATAPVRGAGAKYAQPFYFNTTNQTAVSLDINTAAYDNGALAFHIVSGFDPDSTTYLASAAMAAANSATGWVTLTLDTPATFTAGTQYFLLAEGAGAFNNVYLCDASNATPSGFNVTHGVYYAGSLSATYASSYAGLFLKFRLNGAPQPQWEVLASFGQRGVATFAGSGAPDPEPAAAQAGDLYIDTANGDVYTLEGH